MYFDHDTAMKVWAVSNLLLLVWAIGLSVGEWDGGISGVALVGMYSLYSTTNLYGLWKKAKV